ncbi:MAG: alpha/beta fold hydrolase [Paracoccaceae bacterium]
MANCGYRVGRIVDDTRPNWDETARRPIAWSAWYPTSVTDRGNVPTGHFFDLGNIIFRAPLVNGKLLPVVLLSHGTGGTAESLGWLARALACAGYVVIGANHHGNTGLEPRTAAGFLCWWERATDLSTLLTSLNSSGFFSGQLDLNRVSAVGFSLGGHTVLALAGAQSSMDLFEAWLNTPGIAAQGPAEFPNVADHIPRLFETSEAFRQSWARHQNDFSDHRVKSIVAIAPAPPIRSFTARSVAELNTPLTILTGSADQEAPSEHCAHWIMAQKHNCKQHDLGRHVGHYTFLEFPSDQSLVGQISIFTDHETVDRAKVHKKAAKLVLASLN